MNKINKLKLTYCIILAFTICNNSLFSAPLSNKSNAISKAASKSPTSSTTGGNTSSGDSGSDGSGGGSSTTPVSKPQSSGPTMKVYDPFLDNHLKSPPDGIQVGKFGKRIKELENELRGMGAKNHSYAFGKYSKMVLSSYLITLSFDVNKRLGRVEVEPKLPLKTVEPKAREFFIKFFTEGADLTQIGIIIKPEILELRFLNPD